MITEKIPLSATNPDAFLVTYVPENTPELKEKPVPAMLVIPGGGYRMCSDREAEPIALAYVGYGYAAFVMRYSVGEKAAYPTPLIEASRAMKYIRDNAVRFNVDPERVFCVGFSAGGHLAAELASMWDDPDVNGAVDMPLGYNKPTGAVLSYGVVSYDGGPSEIFDYIARDKYEPKKLSPADAAGENCAPMFIWQTSNDQVVPVKNALDMAAKLASLHKQFELHIFPDGPHGVALANGITESGNPAFVAPSAEKWVALSVEWMNNLR